MGKGLNRQQKNTSNNNQKVNGLLRRSIEKKIGKIILTLAPIGIITFFFLLVVFVGSIGAFGSNSALTATGGYYPIECHDVTIIKVDKNYNPIGNATYPLEEYVAGVINAEVGGFGNYEVYKQFAIAARTYYVKNNNNCVIEASDRNQTFTEVTPSTPNGDLMKKAAEETAGQVLLDNDGNLIQSEYDAFCSIEVDDNYYTIKQKNQKIPKNWVDNVEPAKSGIAPAWKEGKCTGNHGRGMSQWGSYYLATEEDYTYDQLITYYLEDENVNLSNNGFVSSVAGLEVKKTRDSVTNLHEPITTFLESHGSSLEAYNQFIKDSVKQAGVGTREGVVTAAVSSINFLYDNYKINIPYFWGGKHTEVGISSTIGTAGYSKSDCSTCSGIEYFYNGFDCTGFVSWAVRNGGFKFSSTSDYRGIVPSDQYCHITNQSCIGQPGDVLENDGHDMLIVAVDEENDYYYVAEAAGGSTGVVISTQSLHDGNYYAVKMDTFYNNPANVDPNY